MWFGAFGCGHLGSGLASELRIEHLWVLIVNWIPPDLSVLRKNRTG